MHRGSCGHVLRASAAARVRSASATVRAVLWRSGGHCTLCSCSRAFKPRGLQVQKLRHQVLPVQRKLEQHVTVRGVHNRMQVKHLPGLWAVFDQPCLVSLLVPQAASACLHTYAAQKAAAVRAWQRCTALLIAARAFVGLQSTGSICKHHVRSY